MSPSPPSLTPLALLRSLSANSSLILQLTRREVMGRYRGSFLGFFWSFLTPLIMLAVYTFIFSIVFNARWGAAGTSRIEFALILFCGLIVFNIFAECLTRAPTLILGNTIYVKKVVFPLEILPVVALCASLVNALCSFAALILALLVLSWPLSWTIILLPLVIVPLLLLTLGVSWFLASLGVFLRDIGVAIGLLTTVILFMSPIFYPGSAVPARFRMVLTINPIGFIVEQAREVVLWRRTPDWGTWSIILIVTAIIAWLGFAWFQKTRKGFADVI